MIKQFGQLGFGLLLLTIAGNLGLPLRADAQQTGTLTVAVSQLHNQEGNVCLKLFSGSEGFPNQDEDTLENVCVPIVTATESTDGEPDTAASSPDATPAPADPGGSDAATPFRYTFENLPYGNYAVAIYHDRNSDERLNRGLFGMPEEGYGFSNDAPANFGPADFDDAVFPLESADATVTIEMRYP